MGELTVAGYDADGHLLRPDGTRDLAYAAWLADATTRARDAELVVAVSGSELLGTVTWCPPGSPYRELSVSDDQGELRTLSVAPQARGRGIGGALVDWCLQEARRTSLEEVVLSSLPEMRTAHRLYLSRGFERRPASDWSPYEGVDLWAFGRAVGHGPDA